MLFQIKLVLTFISDMLLVRNQLFYVINYLEQ
jgi:hypothetical protein